MPLGCSPAASLLPLILIVDDDEDARAMCALILRDAGFRAEEAEDGAIALEKAIRLEPDAILLDQSMPILDGRETARRLRADPRTRGMALVMLTGFGPDTAQGGELREDGHCDVYLVKPCDSEDIVGALRAALLPGATLRPVAAHAATASPGEELHGAAAWVSETADARSERNPHAVH